MSPFLLHQKVDRPPLNRPDSARALLVSLAFLLEPRRIRLAVAGQAGCDERGGHVGLQDLTHFGRFYVPANSEA